MNLLEIKNNLVKLSYTADESLALGRFVVIVSSEKSYVAQVINLKSDPANNFAIARLLFTFNHEGVVENYDGSAPSISSEVGVLPPAELLNLLPVETPIKIGNLAQMSDILSVDVSVFETNLAVFSEKDSNKKIFISNCVRQLFQMKEKCVIIDNLNMFEDYPKLKIGTDFKLPLNSKMIDFIFENDLHDVNMETKAVIQDIFYAVQQYIDSLDFKFIPIDNFIDVVTNQYRDLQMPELALLKNKLLKYRDANLLANTKDEVLNLERKLKQKSCCIVDIKDIDEGLQREVISLVHSTLYSFDKFVYFFVPLNNGNSDKKLLQQFINNSHVFTTVLASSEYKYAADLKEHAQNIIQFTPEIIKNETAPYSTFLNKLNQDECIVYGVLTHGIPFIVEMNMIKTDLTQDDVLGDRYQFIPVSEELEIVEYDKFGTPIPVRLSHQDLNQDKNPEVSAQDDVKAEPKNVSEVEPEVNEESEYTEEFEEEIQVEPKQEDIEDTVPVVTTEIQDIEQYGDEQIIDEIPIEPEQEYADYQEIHPDVIEPVRNLLQEEDEEEPEQIEDDNPFAQVNMESQEDEIVEPEQEEFSQDVHTLSDSELDMIDAQAYTEIEEPHISDGQSANDDLGIAHDDLDIVQEDTPVVPIYSAQDDLSTEEGFDFVQGDTVEHKKYGRGIIEKIIKYGNKTLCSITFENNVGRRLLDPTITEIVKI